MALKAVSEDVDREGQAELAAAFKALGLSKPAERAEVSQCLLREAEALTEVIRMQAEHLVGELEHRPERLPHEAPVTVDHPYYEAVADAYCLLMEDGTLCPADVA